MSLFIIFIQVDNYSVVSQGSEVFSDKSAVLVSPVENELFNKYGTDEWRTKVKFYFTDKDLKALQALPYVQKVVPVGNTGGGVNSTVIEVDEEHYYASGIKDSTGNPMDFNYLLIPKQVRTNTNLTGLNNEKIIYGETPDDQSKQILISEDLAKTQLKKDENLENLIGTEITIPTYNLFKDSETKDYRFEISGIYSPQEGGKQVNQSIYFAYDKDNYLVKSNSCFLYEPSKIVPCIKQSLSESKKIDFEQLVSSNELGKYPNLYVELKSSADMKQLSGDVNAYDSYLLVDSNYTRKHNNSFKYIKAKVYRFGLFQLIVMLGYLFSLALVNRLLKNQLINLKAQYKLHGINHNLIIEALKKDAKALLIFNLAFCFIFGGVILTYDIPMSNPLIGYILIIVIYVILCTFIGLKRRKKYV